MKMGLLTTFVAKFIKPILKRGENQLKKQKEIKILNNNNISIRDLYFFWGINTPLF